MRLHFFDSAVIENSKLDYSRWLLIVSIFQMQVNFSKVCSPFCMRYCGDCVKENTDRGHAECLARRQEEYQRTLCDLRLMYGRVTESARPRRINVLRIWIF